MSSTISYCCPNPIWKHVLAGQLSGRSTELATRHEPVLSTLRVAVGMTVYETICSSSWFKPDPALEAWRQAIGGTVNTG